MLPNGEYSDLVFEREVVGTRDGQTVWSAQIRKTFRYRTKVGEPEQVAVLEFTRIEFGADGRPIEFSAVTNPHPGESQDNIPSMELKLTFPKSS